MKIDVTYVNGVPDQFIASHGNQIKDEIQNALSCSQVPNSADSFQLSKHIAMASMVNDYCIDSGVANSYVAQVSGSYQNPTNLTAGMEIKLNALNANTGASTLNLASLGAKDIKKSDGVTDIEAGDIIVGDNYLKYNGTCWCLKSAVFDELSAKTQAISDNSKKVATTGFVNDFALSKIYPIGSIYMSVVNTSPASFLGGTWEVWGTGKVPVGVDNTQTEFDTVEKTGGEKTHLLTGRESGIQAHYHTTLLISSNVDSTSSNAYREGESIAYRPWNTNTIGDTNALDSHNNLQPYITCYMWKRIS